MCSKSALRGGKTKILERKKFLWAMGIRKRLEKSRIFRYGMPEDFLSKGPKSTMVKAVCLDANKLDEMHLMSHIKHQARVT